MTKILSVKIGFSALNCRPEVENKSEDVQATKSGFLGAELSVSKYVSIALLCFASRYEESGFLVLLCVPVFSM